jgi:hypothetical protein
MRVGRIFSLGFIDNAEKAERFGLEPRVDGYGYVLMQSDSGTHFTLVGERSFVEMLSEVSYAEDDEGGDSVPLEALPIVIEGWPGEWA